MFFRINYQWLVDGDDHRADDHCRDDHHGVAKLMIDAFIARVGDNSHCTVPLLAVVIMMMLMLTMKIMIRFIMMMMMAVVEVFWGTGVSHNACIHLLHHPSIVIFIIATANFIFVSYNFCLLMYGIDQKPTLTKKLASKLAVLTVLYIFTNIRTLDTAMSLN